MIFDMSGVSANADGMSTDRHRIQPCSQVHDHRQEILFMSRRNCMGNLMKDRPSPCRPLNENGSRRRVVLPFDSTVETIHHEHRYCLHVQIVDKEIGETGRTFVIKFTRLFRY